MEEHIFSAIGNIGFPAALCVYLVAKLDSTIQRLTEAIHDNTDSINRLEVKLDDRTR